MKTLFYIFLFHFVYLASLFAQEPIDLIHHIENSYIGKHISYFEDKDGTYAIQSIDSLPDELFTVNRHDIINFGFSKSVFWLRFVATNKDSLTNWIAEIRSPDLDRVTLYYKDRNGSWKEKSDGDIWPMFKRDIDSRNIAFRLPTVNEKKDEYFIRIKSTGPITIPLKIESQDFFMRESVRSEVFYGICYGIMIIMLLYNLFIYFSIREASYLYYVFSVSCSLLFYGFYYLHIPQYITHFKSPVSVKLLPLLGSLLGITSLQFVRVFLNISAISKFYHRLIQTLIILYFLNILLLFIDPLLSSKINAYLAFVASMTVLLSSFSALRKGSREARFFILGWSFYLITVIVFVLRITGALPNYGFLMNILLIGSIVEIALQSFALADKINIYRKQKEQAQEQIIHLREEDAAKLEQKVKERTIQLEHANEEITLANKDLEVFSHTASHDLRAPLRSVTNFTKLLEKKLGNESDEDIKHYLSIIQTSTKGMEQLIEDLLAFARLGKKEILKEKINMKDMVENVIVEIKSGLKTEQVNIKIAPLDNSFGDMVLLKQVWINLISNAIKFSAKKPKPEIEIGSKISDKEVTYWVKDNGAGFNMQYANKLFQAFQRLHQQTEFEGTGLGLSIVKRIITGHGGRVWAESIEGKGATFYFSLPK